MDVVFDVTEVADRWRIICAMSASVVHSKTFDRFDQMPERITIAVSILAMHPDGTRVERLGQKVTRNAYWVFGDRALVDIVFFNGGSDGKSNTRK